MLDDIFQQARERSQRMIALTKQCVFPFSTSSRCAPTRPPPMRWRRRRSWRRPPTGSATPATGSPSTTTCLRSAATSPPVLIAYLAAQTSQLRLGSGGVMLPNHAPLAVAEQFALLEAAAPGPHRPGHRPRARLRPGDVDGAARRGRPRRPRHRGVPGVPRRRGRADERARRAGAAAADLMRRLHPQGHARRGQRAAAVAAGVVDVLGASGRGQGPAVRVRPPLLRPGHRRGTGGVPLRVPAQRRWPPNR